jgi:hypothetical protein
MARSIHSTKKDRLREAKFARNDDVPASGGMTALEQDRLNKDMFKLNANWKRKAEQHDTPAYGKVKLKGKVSKTFQRRRQTKQPDLTAPVLKSSAP